MKNEKHKSKSEKGKKNKVQIYSLNKNYTECNL